MSRPRFDSWPWIFILFLSLSGEIIIQVIWYKYQLSVEAWLLTQFLFISWALLAGWRVLRSRTTDESSNPERLSTDPELESVVNTEDLVGSIVHEIRNPLNRLNMRLQSRDDLSDQVSGDLDELADTVDRIETVFRGHTPEKRWLTVPRLLKQLFHRMEQENRVRCRSSLSWIHCAPESLNMVLGNLIDNSLEAYDNRDGEVVLTLKGLGPEFCITVEDKAGGIDPDLARTINRDQSKETSGMGLGLMISRKIMGQHGGRMVVESETDVGTTVTLTIPIPGDIDWTEDERK